MEHTNEEILLWYLKGFKAELKYIDMTPPDGILEYAFNIGRNHALIGDDIRSIDYLTDDEILYLIHKAYKQ